MYTLYMYYQVTYKHNFVFSTISSLMPNVGVPAGKVNSSSTVVKTCIQIIYSSLLFNIDHLAILWCNQLVVSISKAITSIIDDKKGN
jgi:hypothetical protein